MWQKIKAVSKKIFLWILGIFSAIGVVLLIINAKKIMALFGKVIVKRNWKKIPGSDTSVMVRDSDEKWVVVDLPINPHTGEQIKTEDIDMVGLSHEGGIYVEVLHRPTNRHNDGDNTSGGMSGI